MLRSEDVLGVVLKSWDETSIGIFSSFKNFLNPAYFFSVEISISINIGFVELIFFNNEIRSSMLPSKNPPSSFDLNVKIALFFIFLDISNALSMSLYIV